MTPQAHTQSLRSRAVQATAPAALLVLALLGSAFPAHAQKRVPVYEQYQQAVKLRDKLESKSEKDRTLADYKTAANAFRKIFMSTSRIPEAPDSLFAAARLYREMGRQFEPEYFDTAIVTYRFLLRSYTNSHYRADALFSIGQIQQQDQERLDDAKATFQEYLKQFPKDENANDARVALDQIAEARATQPPQRLSRLTLRLRRRQTRQVPRAAVRKVTTCPRGRQPPEAQPPPRVRVHHG